MKKKIICALLGMAFCYLAAGMIPAKAAESLGTGESNIAIVEGKLNDVSAMTAIESYFANKVADKVVEENIVIASDVDVNSVLLQTVTDRKDKFNELETRLGVEFQDVTILSEVKEILSQTDNALMVNVSEYTVISYEAIPGSGYVDVMSYETPHCITLGLSNGKYEVVADSYDERMITGACSADILDLPVISEADVEFDGDWQINNDIVPRGEYPTYDVQAVIDYAHQYCGVPSSLKNYTNDAGYNTGTMNPSQYNPAYNYYSGADCANFVSQCLVAGGLPRDTTWHEYTSAWKGARNLHDYLNTKFTRFNANNNNIYPGNPVCWVNPAGSSSTGHQMICTGYNSAGTPVLDGHNPDMFRIPWTNYNNHTLYTFHIVSSDEHIHTGTGLYYYDTYGHYRLCKDCRESVGYAKHTVSNNKCTWCGYTGPFSNVMKSDSFVTE